MEWIWIWEEEDLVNRLCCLSRYTYIYDSFRQGDHPIEAVEMPRTLNPGDGRGMWRGWTGSAVYKSTEARSRPPPRTSMLGVEHHSRLLPG